MNVSLPDEMREWVEQQAKSGRYANASDYVRDLIRHDQDARAVMGWSEDEMLAFCEPALGSLERGDGVAADTVFGRLERKYQAMIDASEAN